MNWILSNRCDPDTRLLADRHYNRQKVGAVGFVPPGRCLVLLADNKSAFLVTSFPYAQFVKHAWAGAFVCSAFRNEGNYLSSDLIRQACACTIWKWPEIPDLGMVTFINMEKVRKKRDFGRCYLRAGFKVCGKTKSGLLALQLLPENFPKKEEPLIRDMQSCFTL